MFSLDNVIDYLWPQAKPALWQKKVLKKLLHEEEFQQFAARHHHLKGLDTVEQVLEHLNIRCAIPAHDLEQIPEHGPLVIIANHPTGTLDGLALLYAVSRVRRDVKVVTNRMLTHLEPLSSLFIPVDNINGRTAKAALQQMDQQLQNGGVLIFFPAGEVSRLTRRGIRDKKWHSGFIKLAAKYRAPLLPAWIRARNSALFYASTLMSENLPLLLLMQQMFRRRNSSLPVNIGQQITWSNWFNPQSSSRELTERCYRHWSYSAKGCRVYSKPKALSPVPKTAPCSSASWGRLKRWGARRMVKSSISGSAATGRCADTARAGPSAGNRLPRGGEGSGKRRDVDVYDDDYLQLILWDEEDLEIVGAYRFMPTAIQLEKRGLNGIYSYSLFHYDARMDDILQHGIELGRSFIQPRYWGRRGLDYLWSGIGAYLARYPHYRYLFGPVSISGGLPPSARDLLVAFYRLWFPATHPLAESRRPYPASLPDVLAQFGGEDYNDDLARLKSLLGNLGCAIPPLYKQYSEVCEPGGVQFIDFGSDPDFNNCVDGLVLVDLTYLKANRYQRYIGVHLDAQKSA